MPDPLWKSLYDDTYIYMTFACRAYGYPKKDNKTKYTLYQFARISQRLVEDILESNIYHYEQYNSSQQNFPNQPAYIASLV